MASRRRKGRPRKNGHRYKSGNLKAASHDPAVSPAQVAATQPHRKGLGDHAVDQLAESELGRMVIRGQLTRIQHLAGQRYAAQWRAYVGTLDGPRSPQRGQGRGSGCNPAECEGRGRNCICELARRSWGRLYLTLSRAGLFMLVNMVVIHDGPCGTGQLAGLRGGLDLLAVELGLTTRNKSDRFGNASSEAAPT